MLLQKSLLITSVLLLFCAANQSLERETFSNKDLDELHCNPNPFITDFSIEFESEEHCVGTLKMFNGYGQLIFTDPGLEIVAGHNKYELEKSELQHGIYYIMLKMPNRKALTSKILKQDSVD